MSKRNALNFQQSRANWVQVLTPAVVVSALGYFVDIYDLTLFSIVRRPSLESLGYQGVQLQDVGALLLNLQMFGMLLGGLLWGVIGDKRGRLSVLYGSIALYSIANIGNALVHNLSLYGVFRFIAGVGLAGELGASITLVSESLPKKLRGYGTTIVVAFGAAGAIAGGLIGESLDWRWNYVVGGSLGLVLLGLRIRVRESHLFKEAAAVGHVRGNLMLFFRHKTLAIRLLKCIAIGLPVWYIVGILITFSPELALAQHASANISAARAVSSCYFGLVFGDVISGVLSQLLRTRKWVVLGFLGACSIMVAYFLTATQLSENSYYVCCALLGAATGYWIVLMTLTAEQFGTNMRATATTAVPNFVRGAVIPLTISFKTLQGSMPILQAAGVLGIVCLGLAATALFATPETHEKDLNFLESA